uniref:Uncharacterized protein n=1 Tax=Strongyloides papillosus TaxID=174720 RepID=A0A0N5BA10_STREA
MGQNFSTSNNQNSSTSNNQIPSEDKCDGRTRTLREKALPAKVKKAIEKKKKKQYFLDHVRSKRKCLKGSSQK